MGFKGLWFRVQVSSLSPTTAQEGFHASTISSSSTPARSNLLRRASLQPIQEMAGSIDEDELETGVLLPMIKRCVWVEEYPGSVHALLLQTMLCVSHNGRVTGVMGDG